VLLTPLNIKALSCMPTVRKIGPYRVFFASHDYSEPPHVHVQREDKVAKFWLDPVALQKTGGFKPKELNRIAKLVQRNRNEFLERWYEFFGR
jgi:hypothetical protein